MGLGGGFDAAMLVTFLHGKSSTDQRFERRRIARSAAGTPHDGCVVGLVRC
jgi:hypothetical protein